MKSAGVIRVCGSPGVLPVLERWERALVRSNPSWELAIRLAGSDVGMAALYTGLADIALLGRECTAVEEKAFEWIWRYPPARVQILTGSLDRPGQSPPLVVFVHRDNPLSRLTLVELDAIFGCERLLGGGHDIRTWGGLGLTGEWGGKLINLYSHDVESGTGRFFRHVVLRDSRKMNWDVLHEFGGAAAATRILEALAADRFGLAVVAGVDSGRADVKPLALARSPGEPFFEVTRANLISRRYNLTRTVYAYFNRAPEGPLGAGVGDFLRHVLSPQGQRAVAEGQDYLPLEAELAQVQLSELEHAPISVEPLRPALPDQPRAP